MSTQKNEHNPEPELKPCPFCGGVASYRSRFDVKCSSCDAEINSLNPAAAWNRRIAPPTDTTGSGREGETPETDAIDATWDGNRHLRGQLSKELFKHARQLERQRDAALAQVEALRRDGEIVDILEKFATIRWPIVADRRNIAAIAFGVEAAEPFTEKPTVRATLRAAIDSAQRQEAE